ncbi:MAG: hypothetical protein A2Y10_09475 [Planctomycetes bacterium GWF2_41_51]|nr:MAG: hypothetical protein A2Y10_09475 [Planctomycetes bacterium GWF2_41_51]
MADAAILNVSDIQIACPGVFYSYSGSSGNLNLNLSFTGLLKIENESYDYSISSAKIIMSSALVQDTSSSGYASGLFSGGRTMTITGTIKHTPTNTTVYTGTILAATMDIDSTETWTLTESPSLAINGNVDFTPDTTFGLGSGINFGSDIIKIGSFRSDFAFKGLMSNPTRFNTNQTLMGVSSTVQITAIPEPVSFIIFATAALALRFKKNNNKI